MKPTDKEIRLAKRLKDLGLRWIPQRSDKFHDGIRHDFVRQHYKGYIEGGMGYMRSQEHREEVESCVWLPSVEQTFVLLCEQGCRTELRFLDEPNETAWYAASDGWVNGKQGLGFTCCEALYQLLLKKVEADCDQ